MYKFCTGCDQSKPLSEFGKSLDKRRGSYYTRNRCKSCNNKYQKEYAERLGDAYRKQRREIKKKRKEENPVKFHIQERISQWRKSDSESDLTTKYLEALWDKQKGLCYYTKVPLVPGGKKHPTPTCASLDRLDPSVGYKKGNVVWACYQANTSKGARTEQEFYDFCRTVLFSASTR